MIWNPEKLLQCAFRNLEFENIKGTVDFDLPFYIFIIKLILLFTTTINVQFRLFRFFHILKFATSFNKEK